MSLDKAIESGDEHRKSYRGAKKIDKSCCNHGSCKWCASNRLYSRMEMDEAEKQMIGENMDKE